MSQNHQPPSHLSDAAKQIWNDIAPKRAKSQERRILLAQSLEEFDRAAEAKAVLDSEGLTFENKKTGAVHQRPEVRIEREARNAFAKLWKLLHLEWNCEIDGKIEYEDEV